MILMLALAWAFFALVCLPAFLVGYLVYLSFRRG